MKNKYWRAGSIVKTTLFRALGLALISAAHFGKLSVSAPSERSFPVGETISGYLPLCF
jgi:hypothetical protein